MRKMLSCILVGMIVTACGSSSYERDPRPGKIINITIDEMVSKINKQDSFAIALTQSMCIYCEEFEEMFNEYAQEHHVILY